MLTNRWMVLLGLAALMASATVLAQSAPAPPYARPYTPTFGPANAKVHVVEFLDPACEGCRAFYPVVKQIMADNPGRIRLWVRYAAIHKNADFAVKALEAARAQDKLPQALDILFARQDQWTRGHAVIAQQVLGTLANVPGLDMERLKRDMNNAEFAKIVDQDLADAKALKVMQTPTFFINGKPLTQYSFENLRAQIQQEIATQYR